MFATRIPDRVLANTSFSSYIVLGVANFVDKNLVPYTMQNKYTHYSECHESHELNVVIVHKHRNTKIIGCYICICNSMVCCGIWD